ncbi:MAG: ArnT family glycosyltransferase [Fluviicola sp.]
MTVKQRNLGLIIFLAILASLCILYYDSVLEKGPLGNHIWRQADCLSITKKYQEGASFSEPEMHMLWADNYTTGKSAGEFPGLYYLTGNLWKLTGESFLLYRLIWLIIMVAGLMAMFRSLQILYDSNFWAGAITIVVFSSPAYAFYGVSFLSDAPAFGFLMMSLYFLLLYHKNKQVKWIYFFAGFMAVSGLLKASMLIAFVFLGFIYLLETIFNVKTLKSDKLFQHKWHGFFALGIVVVLEVAWMAYARDYNKTHGYYYTFNQPNPYWNASEDYLLNFWKNIKLLCLPVFHNTTVLILMGLTFITNILLIKKLPLFASLANIIIALGCASYFFLWSGFISVHDYYFVPFLMLLLSTFLPLLYWLRQEKKNISELYILKALVGILLFFSVYYCKEIVSLKTGRQEGDSWIVTNNEFESLMRWQNWMVAEHWNSLYFIRPKLEKMGVGKNDKVICYPDQSFSVSLYLLNRDGWTNMMGFNSVDQIEKLKAKGAKFLITHDPQMEDVPFLNPYRTHEVGRLKNVRVYKL